MSIDPNSFRYRSFDVFMFLSRSSVLEGSSILFSFSIPAGIIELRVVVTAPIVVDVIFGVGVVVGGAGLQEKSLTRSKKCIMRHLRNLKQLKLNYSNSAKT